MANHLTRGAMQSKPRSMPDVTEHTRIDLLPDDMRRLKLIPPIRQFGKNGSLRSVAPLEIVVVGVHRFIRPACP